jgi:glycosyltransferase involved in cell wall biosynthesis
MKVAIILLDYNARTDYTQRVKDVNLTNAGHPFELIIIDRKGVAAAINEGMKQAMDNGADAVVTMANDILMPEGWLKQMIGHSLFIENTGMCGIHVVEELPPTVRVSTKLEGVFAYACITVTPFGNVLIPREAIERVGYFNTDFDPYSINDMDYAHRLRASGFINYYIPGMKAEHIGNDTASESEYRKMKWDALAAGSQKWGFWSGAYEVEKNYYIPYEQEKYIADMKAGQGSTPIIEMNQFGE